ncbi:hypothetical protein GDO78_003847 [Eleutherodactylus coqui]|uniref:Uncharacterized protein n=1 Tax=Eleutherodactylus coqui TaxID=57060 RepID=A0A8J6EVT2_ELECQ|nr:hypothetical protein GDO78_003847 [Eleutherodactylus coqui]
MLNHASLVVISVPCRLSIEPMHHLEQNRKADLARCSVEYFCTIMFTLSENSCSQTLKTATIKQKPHAKTAMCACKPKIELVCFKE